MNILHISENATETDRQDFVKELGVMKQLKPHPNIVTLFGCCTGGDGKKKPPSGQVEISTSIFNAFSTFFRRQIKNRRNIDVDSTWNLKFRRRFDVESTSKFRHRKSVEKRKNISTSKMPAGLLPSCKTRLNCLKN